MSNGLSLLTDTETSGESKRRKKRATSETEEVTAVDIETVRVLFAV